MKKIIQISMLLFSLWNTAEAQDYSWSFNNGTFANDLGTGFDGSTTTPTVTGPAADSWNNANHAAQNTASAFGSIDIGDISYLNGTGDFTLTFWFKFYTPSNPNSNRTLIRKGNNLYISLGTDNKMHCAVAGTDHWNQSLVTLSTGGNGTIHFLALTRSGNTVTLKYANTVNVGYQIPSNIFSVTNTNPTTTTGSILQFLPSCDGIIDDVYLTNSALSNDQIDSLFHRFNPVNPKKETLITFNNQTANNTLGSNYNGIIQSEVKFIADRFGNPCQAVTFDGNPQHVSLLQDITMGDQYTISGWFQKNALGTLFYNGSTITGGYERLFYDAVGDKLYGQTVSNSTYTNSNNCTAQGCSNTVLTSIPNGTWFHVAYVRTHWDLKIYINGQFFSSVSSGLSYPTAAMNFYLGSNPNSTFNASNAGADDLYIVNRALSLTQIDSLRNLPNPGVLGTCPVITPKWIRYSFNNQDFNNDLGPNNPGSSQCGFQFSTDRFGNANMAGPSCDIWCGNVGMFNYAKKMTVTGWFVKHSNTFDSYLYSQKGVTELLGVYQNANEELIAQSGTQTTTLVNGNTAFTAIQDNDWFHLAYVLDTAANGVGNLKLYLNGTLYAQNNNISSYIFTPPYVSGSTYTGEFILGGNYQNQGYFRALDDIYMTNQALTQTQIDSLKNINLTSMDHSISKLKFEVYPNPVSDALSIRSEIPFEKYEISDLTGRVLQKGGLDKPVSVFSLTPGIYFLRLISSQGSAVHQFVKE